MENFSQTFFVGGMVRDLLLGQKVLDIDIATGATPEEVFKVLSAAGILYNDQNKRYGSVVAKSGPLEVEITTLRKDLAGEDRYHNVKFITNPTIDSKRRDFTINSLYLSLKDARITDYNGGLNDLKEKRIKFIGDSKKRIQEDPLRIIRALRFCLTLNFNLEKSAKDSIQKNFVLLKGLSKSRIEKEILKINNSRKRKILKQTLVEPKSLDKYFK